LIPKDTLTDFDAGMAVSTKCSFVPTTKHTRKAWNETHNMWKKQKSLRAGIGPSVNYDEMEFRYDSSHSYDRASSLFQGGLADSDADTLTLLGTSSEGSNQFALQDYYNSRHPVGSVSKYSYNNTTIKERKYSAFWPTMQPVYVTSTLSAAVAEAGEAPAVYLSAANASAPLSEFDDPLNVMCGLMKIQNYVITDDTTTQVEDYCYLQVEIHVKKWSSLIIRRKPRRSRRSRGRAKGYRSRYNRSRGRRYSRRRR